MNYEPESNWLNDNFFNQATNGTYVDLGAGHPIRCSLTSFVRDKGWNGVAVDGNPDYEKDWRDAGFLHHFRCAVLSQNAKARFVIHENSFTSRISDTPDTDNTSEFGINRIVEVDTVPVNAILESAGIGKVNLLTVDLEGNEFEVMRTLDFKKHDPDLIVSEYVTQGDGTDPRAANLLISMGYEIVHVTEANMIYRKK